MFNQSVYFKIFWTFDIIFIIFSLPKLGLTVKHGIVLLYSRLHSPLKLICTLHIENMFKIDIKRFYVRARIK